MRYSKAAAFTSTIIPGTNDKRNVVVATTTLNLGASTKTRMAEKAGQVLDKSLKTTKQIYQLLTCRSE